MLTEPRPGHQRSTIQQVHDHLTKTLLLDVSFSAVSAYVRSRRKHLNQIGKPGRQPSAR
jgi:predicted transcriptional regulator